MELKEKIDREIKKLMKTQLFGVLATRNETEILTSVVSFVSGENYESIFFSTLKPSRKFNNIISFPKISFLVDNRNNIKNDLTEAIAVSFIGTAVKADENEIILFKEKMLGKNRNLTEFLNSPNNVIVKIKVDQIDFVSRFQNVIILKAENNTFRIAGEGQEVKNTALE